MTSRICSTSETLPEKSGSNSGRARLLNVSSYYRSNNLPFRSAAWQFETANACLPASRASGLPGGRVVFVDIPERTVDHRVDIEGCVVTPARIRCGLHT